MEPGQGKVVVDGNWDKCLLCIRYLQERSFICQSKRKTVAEMVDITRSSES